MTSYGAGVYARSSDILFVYWTNSLKILLFIFFLLYHSVKIRGKACYYLYITLILILVLLTKIVVGDKCEFCNKELIHLSKHTWRCKSKITSIITVATESTNRSLTSNESLVTVNHNNEIITCVNQDFDPHENQKRNHEFRCYFGRSFNSLRELNTQRKMCFVGESINVKKLFKDVVEIVNYAPYKNDAIIDYEDLPKGLIKKIGDLAG